jgi:hypothetical protein
MAEDLKTIMWLFIGRAVERNASSSGSLFQLKASPPIRAENPQRRDSLAERGEFELPVPICEQSDDRIRLSFATSRRTAKRYRPCSAFLVLFRIAGSNRGKMACSFI